jgi:hypothetical protein
MRRALVAGVALTVVLSGCGGGSDEQQARDTAKGFVDALRSNDGAKACSYLTDDGRARFTQLGDTPCEQGILSVGSAAEGRVSGVRMSGDRATVTLTNPSGRLQLVKQGDHWSVDSAG